MRPSTVGALSLSAAMGIAVFSYSMHTAAALDSQYADGQQIETEAFDSVVLSGGGDITITPGDEYGVKINSGAEALRLEIENGALKVNCKRPCRNSNINVDVTTTELEAIVIAGGGDIRIEGAFALRDDFSVVITGGGMIDAYGAPAKEVDIAITGGGRINVSAEEELDVAIVGGGTIYYKGNPDISKSVIGGGTVTKS